MSTRDEFKDCVRLSESERRHLFDALDDVGAASADAAKRQFERVPYAGAEVQLSLEGSGYNEVHRFLGISRNISASGMSVLHGGFVYPGTRCSLALKTIWGESERVEGTVAHCRLVRGRVHELGIRFKHLVDTRCFVGGNHRAEETGVGEPLVRLRGTVLSLDDQEVELMLLKHHLRESGVRLITATTPEEAMGVMSTTAVDLFLCDLDLGTKVEPGEEVIRRARESGYSGPIVALTGQTSSERLMGAKRIGAGSVLLKPYNTTKLMQCLAEHLLQDTGVVENEPIRSTLTPGGGGDELLRVYIDDVRQRSEYLLSESDEGMSTVLELCKVLKETGAGFGYAPLSEAAASAHEALAATSSLEESRQELLKLRGVIDRLAPEFQDAA